MFFTEDRFPKLFKLFEKLGFKDPFEYEYSFRSWLDDFPPGKWWFLYRFHPKHRYNIVDLRLNHAYYEANTRLFYAIFRIFEEHVEEAKGFVGGYDFITGNDPDFDTYIQNEPDETTREWYQDNRKTFEDFYEAWHYWLKIDKNFESYSEKLCCNEKTKKWNGVLEQDLEQEKTAMLLKIVSHQNSLWC